MKLYDASEIPEYLREPFIEGSYRAHLTFGETLLSVFQVHNETAQIWTHLLPAVFFWYTAILNSRQGSTDTSKYVLAMLCASFATVFSASAFAHTFYVIDEDWFHACWKFDWASINFALFGVSSCLAYAAFYQQPAKQRKWIGVFLVQMIALLTVFTSTAFHHIPIAFKAMTVVGVPTVPILGFIMDLRKNVSRIQQQRAWNTLARPMAVLLVGMAAYGTRFPESYFPEHNFDMSRGHHLIHHAWSTTFAWMILRGCERWLEQVKKDEGPLLPKPKALHKALLDQHATPSLQEIRSCIRKSCHGCPAMDSRLARAA